MCYSTDRMVEISQIEYSFSPGDNYISELCDLPKNRQHKIIDFISSERILGRFLFDFDKNQTIGFTGKLYDQYGQLIVDSRFVLNGYHQFSPRQVVTGKELLPLMESCQIYEDD